MFYLYVILFSKFLPTNSSHFEIGGIFQIPILLPLFIFFFDIFVMNGIDGERDLKSYTKRLYWCVLFYMTANALVLPITPYFATSLNATNTQYSLVFTIYYIAMLLGILFLSFLLASFIFGKIGDTYGRRIALLVSLFGLTTCICHFFK